MTWRVFPGASNAGALGPSCLCSRSIRGHSRRNIYTHIPALLPGGLAYMRNVAYASLTLQFHTTLASKALPNTIYRRANVPIIIDRIFALSSYAFERPEHLGRGIVSTEEKLWLPRGWQAVPNDLPRTECSCYKGHKTY